MRITKEMAHICASKMTEHYNVSIKEEREILSSIVDKLHKENIPKGVFDFFLKHGDDYISTTKIARLFGRGLNGEWVNFSTALPSRNRDIASLQLNDIDAGKIVDGFSKIRKHETNRNELKKSIEVALFNLRTLKNVTKELPEALEFLPKENVNTTLEINISDIRNQLNNR